jgi:hypothetical protein
MGSHELLGFRVAVLRIEGLKHTALEDQIRMLKEADAEVSVIVTRSYNLNTDEGSLPLDDNIAGTNLLNADPADYDGLVLCDCDSQLLPSDVHSSVADFIQDMSRQDKPIAIIRHQRRDLNAFNQDMLSIFTEEKCRRSSEAEKKAA